jgi:hypothetical protein
LHRDMRCPDRTSCASVAVAMRRISRGERASVGSGSGR